MTDKPDYTPPKVWTWNSENGGAFMAALLPVSIARLPGQRMIKSFPWASIRCNSIPSPHPMG